MAFTCQEPCRPPFEYKRNSKESEIIDAEVNKLLSKGVISYTTPKEGDYFSNLFVTPKKDGSLRTILNLKKLNESCSTSHFKMESLKNAISMIKPGSYMCTIDIKDAFYTVPIYNPHKRYLKFMWKGQAYRFEVMPNGYKDAMRVFTKLLKPIMAKLREEGHKSTIYVDDGFLCGDDDDECWDNIFATCSSLSDHGFAVHLIKSILIPRQIAIFLGFIFNTIEMTISLTGDKKQKIKNLASKILSVRKICIRTLAKFLGNIVAAFEAIPMGRLYYRNIELDKVNGLKASGGDFDKSCNISYQARIELIWWLENIDYASRSLLPHPQVDFIIYTDASDEGWGAYNGSMSIGGRWNPREFGFHINVKETKSIWFSLLSFCQETSAKHIRIMSDNSTAISYVNKLGGMKSRKCNALAKKIWEWCIHKGVHISAAHIPGILNKIADKASRLFFEAAEWSLSILVFREICSLFGMPDIDLFATRLNKKLPVFISWRPDPESTFVDAFSIDWGNFFSYAFPPFSMMWPTVKKVSQESDRALIIAPDWPTQSWYPSLFELAIDFPVIISSTHLSLPGTNKSHPLAPKLRLIAVLCSRDKVLQNRFRQKSSISCARLGGRIPGRSMPALPGSGRRIVVKGVEIPIKRLRFS